MSPATPRRAYVYEIKKHDSFRLSDLFTTLTMMTIAKFGQELDIFDLRVCGPEMKTVDKRSAMSTCFCRFKHIFLAWDSISPEVNLSVLSIWISKVTWSRSTLSLQSNKNLNLRISSRSAATNYLKTFFVYWSFYEGWSAEIKC